LEDHITKAGLEVRVDRKYYKLIPIVDQIKVSGSRGQALDQKVQKYERLPLANLATLKSGDLVEIELEIQSKNDYEYLIFEDMKPAGFEPMDVQSATRKNDMGAIANTATKKSSSSSAPSPAANTVSDTGCAPKSPANSALCRRERRRCTHQNCAGIRMRSSCV